MTPVKEKALELGIPVYQPVKLREQENYELLKSINPDKNIGINMLNGKTVNMLDAGIVDPASASRLALENAVSVTMLYLSTACVVVPELVEF